MDVHPLIKKNFDKAVRLMVEDKNQNVDYSFMSVICILRQYR